jgi:preprotein translocase subunit SecE|tara:strand:- start:463 stop:843 length:381 start_codon:yes stop_codon:yes gene_type:complete
MGKDDATWLNICYVVFAALSALIFYKAIYTLGLQLGWLERFDEWYSSLSNVVAILLGMSAAYWLRSSEIRRDFHLSSITEMRKVAWPSGPDTKRMTLIVVVVVAIFAVILAFFDMMWQKALQFILP